MKRQKVAAVVDLCFGKCAKGSQSNHQDEMMLVIDNDDDDDDDDDKDNDN